MKKTTSPSPEKKKVDKPPEEPKVAPEPEKVNCIYIDGEYFNKKAVEMGVSEPGYDAYSEYKAAYLQKRRSREAGEEVSDEISSILMKYESVIDRIEFENLDNFKPEIAEELIASKYEKREELQRIKAAYAKKMKNTIALQRLKYEKEIDRIRKDMKRIALQSPDQTRIRNLGIQVALYKNPFAKITDQDGRKIRFVSDPEPHVEITWENDKIQNYTFDQDGKVRELGRKGRLKITEGHAKAFGIARQAWSIGTQKLEDKLVRAPEEEEITTYMIGGFPAELRTVEGSTDGSGELVEEPTLVESHRTFNYIRYTVKQSPYKKIPKALVEETYCVVPQFAPLRDRATLSPTAQADIYTKEDKGVKIVKWVDIITRKEIKNVPKKVVKLANEGKPSLQAVEHHLYWKKEKERKKKEVPIEELDLDSLLEDEEKEEKREEEPKELSELADLELELLMEEEPKPLTEIERKGRKFRFFSGPGIEESYVEVTWKKGTTNKYIIEDGKIKNIKNKKERKKFSVKGVREAIIEVWEEGVQKLEAEKSIEEEEEVPLPEEKSIIYEEDLPPHIRPRNKKSEFAHLCLEADSLREHGEYDKSIECLEKALEIDSESDRAWVKKGRVLSDMGKHDEAIECYDTALEICPEDAGLWNCKGRAIYKQGKFDEALECFAKALEIEPVKGSIVRALARDLKEEGKFDEAIKYYNIILEKHPKDKTSWFSKADILYEQNKFDEAIKCYDSALEIDPNYSAASSNKAKSLHNLSKYEEAANCLENALKTEPKNKSFWNLKGNAHHSLKQYDKAAECYGEAIALDPKNKVFWNNKGNSLRLLGKHNEAIECLERALEIDPGYKVARKNLEKAKVELKGMAESKPESSDGD